jgi:hypothetical protein
MTYFLAGLAVYKAVQMLDALSPREAMPWVKVLVGILFGYGAAFLLKMDDPAIAGLAVASIASGCHSVLRLATLLGDMALNRLSK